MLRPAQATPRARPALHRGWARSAHGASWRRRRPAHCQIRLCAALGSSGSSGSCGLCCCCFCRDDPATIMATVLLAQCRSNSIASQDIDALANLKDMSRAQPVNVITQQVGFIPAQRTRKGSITKPERESPAGAEHLATHECIPVGHGCWGRLVGAAALLHGLFGLPAARRSSLPVLALSAL